jgi:hypothetical protein
MPISTTLRDKLQSIEQNIVQYKRRAAKLPKITNSIQQKLQQLQTLSRTIQKLLSAAEAEQAPQEDDWQTLLERSDLPEASKKLVKELFQTVPTGFDAATYVATVQGFYQKYYSNPAKYLTKLGEGLDISPKQYHNYLQKAIAYTIQKKGKTATSKDFSINFILLLKGRLKENDLQKGQVEYALANPTINGSQITIKNWEIEDKVPDITAWLNKKHPFAKSMFHIAATTISIHTSGVASFDQGKMLETTGNPLGQLMPLTGELLAREMAVSLQQQLTELNVATAEGKLVLQLPFNLSIELGVKVADFILTIGKQEDSLASFDSSITPIELNGKLVLDLQTLLQLFPNEDALKQFVEIKLEVELGLSTELGINVASEVAQNLSKEISEEFSETLKEQELLAKKQVKLHQQQQVYIELVEQTNHTQQLYQERQELLQQAQQEVDPKKKRQLEKKAFKKAVDIQKEQQAIQKRLLQSDAVSLQDLDKVIQTDSRSIVDTLQKNKQKFEAVTQKIKDKTKRALAETLKRQATKRALSLVAKAIPVINVISLAVDIYDAYTLITDVYETYQQDDTEIPTDAVIEQLQKATIDVTTLPAMVVDFYYGIGIGGKLLELTPKEAQELVDFFKKEFPEGADSKAFESFLWAYGDHFDVVGKGLETNRDLLKDLKLYHEGYSPNLESRNAIVIDAADVDRSKTTASSFFDYITYHVEKGDATKVGSIVEVNGIGMDRRKNGDPIQINFKDEKKLLQLKVIQHLGDGVYKLKPLEDFALHIEGFKTYLLSSTTVFLYKVGDKSLTTRNK